MNWRRCPPLPTPFSESASNESRHSQTKESKGVDAHPLRPQTLRLFWMMDPEESLDNVAN